MISVIIPIYNAERTIVNALNSIKAQTIGVNEFEVIVVNDGSSDESENIVKTYVKENPEMNLQLINQENGGVSKARNIGLKHSKGELVALLDSDDEWHSDKIEKQLNYLNNKSLDIDFLASRRNNHKILLPYEVVNNLAEITFSKLLIRNEAQPSTVIFKRKIIENTGFFNDDQRYAEDVNYWMKISKNNKMYILDESLVIAGGGKRTFGVSGLSANLKEMKNGYKRNLKEMYALKYLSLPQYTFYHFFYKAKYLLLLFRQFCYNLNTKKN
ncbi:glycosyltransferase family A protein [Chryseobacterium sp.]|uniref:glycosyltransferase family 2 protein n=1 Tax=Chryseobacterium sp. TaxID=1871047 RepID=UPI002896B15A|nr:glycosyltransferase family A protein [Chryseobacterium sp.]